MKWNCGGRNAPVKKISYWAWAVLMACWFKADNKGQEIYGGNEEVSA